MEGQVRKKMEDLDDFYLVKVIRDWDKFGYDEETVRTARRILKKRGRSEADLEEIFSTEIKLQDEKTQESARDLFSSFNKLGTFAIRFYLMTLGFLLLTSLINSRTALEFRSFFLTLSLLESVIFFFIPIVCVSRARRIARILLDQYDNTPSRTLLNNLDRSAGLLLGWFLLTPGFIYSFLKTRKTLRIILRELRILD